ncbi:MAG TPA: toll/interleukin-1 receptor domain-containing protein [Egibacteraceae bacterium]|nr:toll/interleukin-1 receptor domain-containing protein [Actinomycetota bacterium]HWB70584.1 toll/interleukin-1 receptor domain-containing protein [Egibacteraceae bacterium]
MRVFVSYRRSDVGGYAGRLHDALVRRLGAKNVFQDVAGISPGEDFTVAVDHALDACDAVLGVIGPTWLSASTPEGRPRLRQDQDLVRLELARALASDVPVVPVLVGGARLPTAAELPEDLRALAHRQAVVIRDETWHRDVDSLLAALQGPTDDQRPTRRRRALVAVAAAVPAIAVAVWLLPSLGEPQDDAHDEVPACESGSGPAWNDLAIGDGASRTFTQDTGELVFEVAGGRWRRQQPGLWRVILDTTMENRTNEAAYHGEWHYDALVVGRRAFEHACFSPDPSLVEVGTVGDARVGFEVRCPPEGYIELIDDAGRISVTDEALEPSPC